MVTNKETDLLKNRPRARSVMQLIQLYRKSGLDEQTMLTQLMSGFGRSFTEKELEELIKMTA